MATTRSKTQRARGDLLMGALQLAAQRRLLPAEAWACSKALFALAAEHAPVEVHLYGNGRRGDRSLLDDKVISPATPPGVISQLLRRRNVVSLTAEGCFSSCTEVPLPSTLTGLKFASVRGGFTASPLPRGLTSLTVYISGDNFGDDDALDIRQAQMATLIAAAPPTLASLEVDCFSLESLPQPLQLPLRLRELTLRQCLDNVNESTSRPIGDTILPSSLDTLTLEDYKIGPHLQLPRDLRTLCLENCILSWRESSGGRGSNEGNGGRVNQFPVFPDSLITLELESLYSADHDFQHPVLTLPPNIQQVSITCERSDQPELAFNGPLGPLPPSLRTLVIEHPDGCAALPPLPLGLRELTLSEYEHKLQAPLPPSLEALELQGWGKQQSLCDALATFGGGNFQRLTLAGRSQRGGLRSSIGPLPATLTHFTCWLGGGEGEEEDEQDEDNSSDAQLPPLPLGLQELCVNGIALPAALPASLRVVLLGMDVDMSALQEPLEMPGRHVEVGYEYYVTE